MGAKNLNLAVRKALLNSLFLKRNETFLVVTDHFRRRIGLSFFEEANKLCEEALYLEMSPRQVHGEEPPRLVAEAMLNADVIALPTTKSLSHTEARLEACRNGARIASMPGITEAMAKRTLGVNYEVVSKLTKKLARALTRGETARVETPAGTSITFDITGRISKGYDEGCFKKPGSWGNLPAGEAMIAPVEGRTNGEYVIDTGSPLGTGLVDKPIEITVKKGYAVAVKGGSSAKQLEKELKRLGKNAFNIAELGIGTNHKARITGNVLEDEKALGTAHIALGDNISLGGKVSAPCHLDGVMRKPSIWVDDVQIMKDGKVLI